MRGSEESAFVRACLCAVPIRARYTISRFGGCIAKEGVNSRGAFIDDAARNFTR